MSELLLSPVDHAAHRSALREAELQSIIMEARLARGREQLSDTIHRLEARQAGKIVVDEQIDDLRARTAERDRELDLHTEALAARELRITLCRQLLKDDWAKLETLRYRGALAEELLRVKSLELGRVSEELSDRRRQLTAFSRHRLEQRVRVGIERWLPAHLCDEALGVWRERIASRHRQRERLRGVVRIWGGSALHAAWTSWRGFVSGAARRAKRADRTRAQALTTLEAAVEERRDVMRTYWERDMTFDGHGVGLDRPGIP